MAVDPYAPCPCGSGKKLKFCCSDLFGEIDKVHRMLEGDQPRAALAHLEQTLAKTPGRASLLDLKASIEMSLGDAEAAEKTIQEYLRVDPQNPSAPAQAALLAASSTGGAGADATKTARQAVDYLQAALELVDDAIPARVLQAIGAVGQALLSAGDLFAARAHLWLYQGVAGDEDTRAMELLMRLNQVSGLPLLLRDNLFLREAPIGHAAEARHDHAQLLASRGQWGRAAKLLDELCEEHPSLAMLHHNAAVVNGWLGDQQRFVEGLQKFAELTAAASDTGLPDDAVEAEAIAQLLDQQSGNANTDVVRIPYAVKDEEGLVDRLTRDKRTSVHQLSESELRGLNGPPPRMTFLLLDRELPDTGVGITAEQTPRVVGVLSYFGRQTDRAERLELVADRDDRYAETLQLVSEITGEALGTANGEEVVGQSASGESGLRARWRFPDDTPVADRRRLAGEEQRRVLLEDWPNKPLATLRDQSPSEAAKDPALRLALVAALLVLEQTSGGPTADPVFTAVRERLGLPASEMIDPAKADLETLPLARVGRVDLASASDDALLTLYQRTELSGATDAALAIAREAVGRPSLAEDLPPAELYSRLAALEPDVEDALGWIEQGRTMADEAGQSNAVWDLAELELRVMEGHFEQANQLVQHLRDDHLNEPGIAERLYQLLQALGAVPGPGQAAGAEPTAPMPEPAMAPVDSGGSKLWTPGNDEPSGGGKKLWTPT